MRWQHVYGHRGDPNNERVDTIARAYAAGSCPPLFCGQRGAPDDPVVIPPADCLTGTVDLQGASQGTWPGVLREHCAWDCGY